jgi:hypothetical protein
MSPSDRTMALGSTQPLVKMSTRNIPGYKGDRCVRFTTSPPSRAECHEIGEPKPPRTLWATPGLLRDSFPFRISNMYDSRILGVNCRVAVSFSLSSFNLVLRDGMERYSLPSHITIGHARICACVGSKAN